MKGDGKASTDGEMVEGQKMGKTTPGSMFRSVLDHFGAIASTQNTN